MMRAYRGAVDGCRQRIFQTRQFRVSDDVAYRINRIREDLGHPSLSSRNWEIPEILLDPVPDGLQVDTARFEEGAPPEVFAAWLKRFRQAR